MKTLLVAINAHFIHTNLAVRLLQRASGGRAEILELNINLPRRRMLADIARATPELVAFSCYIWNIGHVLALAKSLKAALPGVLVALGGPEVSFDAEARLAGNPEVDFILTGEGEVSFPVLLDALPSGDLSTVPGLWHRRGDRIAKNPNAAPLSPSNWIDPYEPYASGDPLDGLQGRILYAETARGCPYDCGYCLSGGDRPVRALPIAEAVWRLTSLADRGARLIKLVDRTFNFDRSRANAIWASLIDHAGHTGLNPTYHFEIGGGLIDDAAVSVLSTAPKGLFQFEVGIQSATPAVLEAVRRSRDVEAVARGVRSLIALGNAHVHVDLIAGLPGEGLTAFARSFDFAYALGADRLQLGFLKLLRGSALRREAEKLGILYEDEPPYEVICTPALSFADMSFLKDVEVALEWYGNSGRYPRTTRLLTTGRSAFEVYATLARGLRDCGLLDAERGERERASALIELGAGCLMDNAFAGSTLSPRRTLIELVRHDLLAAGRARELPEAASFSESTAMRDAVRARFHPLRGQLGCEYRLDLAEFEQTGRLVERAIAVLYDPAARTYQFIS